MVDNKEESKTEEENPENGEETVDEKAKDLEETGK